MGLREDKKARTRKLISDIATVLFFERGYANVTTSEIAEKAQVSAKTIFNYFPTKESLVFDEDEAIEKDLIKTVIHRKKGQGILDALLELGIASIDGLKDVERYRYEDFIALVQRTPELNAYSQQMWLRHEKALATAIKKEAKNPLSVQEAQAIARFVLDSYHRSFGSAQPKATLKAIFKILQTGWDG